MEPSFAKIMTDLQKGMEEIRLNMTQIIIQYWQEVEEEKRDVPEQLQDTLDESEQLNEMELEPSSAKIMSDLQNGMEEIKFNMTQIIKQHLQDVEEEMYYVPAQLQATTDVTRQLIETENQGMNKRLRRRLGTHLKKIPPHKGGNKKTLKKQKEKREFLQGYLKGRKIYGLQLLKIVIDFVLLAVDRGGQVKNFKSPIWFLEPD